MKKLLFSVLLSAVSAYATDALIDVSHVQMSQNVTSRRVTVTYDLVVTNAAGSTLSGALIQLDVLTNSPSGYVSIGREHIRTISGDYSPSSATKCLVAPGTGKTIVWDARRDFPGRRLSDVKVAVKAYYPGDLSFEAKYLVLNIGENTDETTTYTWELTDVNPDAYNAGNLWRTTASQLWFVRCPAGSFIMGAPGTAKYYQSTRPQHKVTLTQDFFMSIAPVSNHQWSRVSQYSYSNNANAKVNVSIDALMGNTWYLTRTIDSSSIVGKIRARSGLNVTIPTEAQWEYACRAGSQGSFTGTDAFFTTDEAVSTYYQSAFGVAAYKTYNLSTAWNTCTNAWGFAGMHTTVANFCQDTQDAVTTEDAEDPCTRGSSAGFVMRGPWKWGGGATCHDYPPNTGISHSFDGETTGARLVVMP